jgi:transketolase
LRGTFARTLCELAGMDDRLVLLTGDLGYTVLEPFRDAYPDRFLNLGVAEQNMVGVATGLAESGLIPFCYSIGTFASLRPFEFIRNGPVLHHLPVRIVGLGAGFEYGTAGPTHYSLEDVGLMRTQPGMTVIAPADFEQARAALLATWHLPGPVYYRLGKDDRSTVPGLEGRFALDRVQQVREGRELLLLASGPISLEAVGAAAELERAGVDAAVAVVACLNPPPAAALAELIGRFRLVLSVETHYVVGGLGSLVAEVIADRGLGIRLVRCGVATTPDGRSGSAEQMHKRHGLDRAGIANTVQRVLAKVLPR